VDYAVFYIAFEDLAGGLGGWLQSVGRETHATAGQEAGATVLLATARK
jgi:hypothetical protein